MSLIGINGKIGSGKDTIGSIIQYLTDKNVTTETFDFWYASNFYSVYQATGMFKIKKFAGKLKQTASLLTGIPIEKFEDQEFKKTTLGPEWNYHDIIGYGHYNVPVYGESEQEMLVREFLQKLGTEAMRDGLHTNVWCNALFSDYKPICNKFESKMLQTGGNYTSSICSDCNCFPNWIITDMRFPNEMEAVVKRNGITIRVIRSFNHKMGSKETGTLDLTPLHPSETALDDAKFDYEIINDGSIEDLIEKVREILIKENII